MKRLIAAGAVAASVIVMTGCTAQPEIDIDEAMAWAEQQHSGDDDALASAWFTAGPEDPGIVHDGHQTTWTFEEPVAISGYRFSCFGGVTVETVIVVTSDGSGAATGDDVLCDESVFVREYAETDVTEITFAVGSPVPTALVVFIDGER